MQEVDIDQATIGTGNPPTLDKVRYRYGMRLPVVRRAPLQSSKTQPACAARVGSVPQDLMGPKRRRSRDLLQH
jgi:hypothetical protein